MVPTKLRGSRYLLALPISGPPSLQPEPAWDAHNLLYMAPLDSGTVEINTKNSAVAVQTSGWVSARWGPI